MSAEMLAALLGEASALLPDSELAAEPEGRAWGLGIGEEALIVVHLQPDLGRVVMTAEVAPLPQAGAATLRSRLLAFNRSVEESGGLWMSLDSATGAVMQSVDLVLEGLTFERLWSTLDAFLQRLRNWRETFAEMERAAAEPFLTGGRRRILASGGSDATLVPGPLRV